MSTNPFPGLRPFEQKETHLFFGRDGQSNELLRRLQHSRFLALVGVSGSGKSSLVRAGLLPALYGGLMASVESDWRVAVFRPGNNPIGNMAHALITQAGFGGDSGTREIQEAVAETTLRRGNLGLLEFLKQAKRKERKNGKPFFGPDENLLLVVDQFEEIFRIIEQHDQLVRVKHLTDDTADTADTNDFDGNPREEAAAFVKLLLESTRKNKEGQYPENVYIIVTMRSDYLGETAQFWGMPERINEGQYLIPRMTRDERRKAIVGPVAVAKGSISEPLVNELLNDAGENPGQLPILQHALMRMWELWARAPQPNGPIDVKHYEQIGRISGALSQHANEALAEVPPHLKPLAAKIFKCLTEKGLSSREIRRPMSIADICAVVAADEKDVKQVVETFRKEGRWFLMPSPPTKLEHDTLIDISHESLISGWDELKKWVNEEAESAQTYKRLADTAILKERGKEDYYRGPALQLALKWKKENTPNAAWARRYHPEYDKAMTFLGGSDRQASKEGRRRKFFRLLLVVLTGVTVVSSVAALSYQRRSIRETEARAVEAVKGEEHAKLLTIQAKEAQILAQKAQIHAEEAQGIAESAKRDALLKADQLEKSLEAQKVAVRQANEAKKTAFEERDKARRLEGENLEQATIYGYFKIAFDDIAAGSRADAVKNLRKALEFFEKKGDKVNTVSTLINIADVLRNTPGGTNDVVAVKEYKRALSLLGSSNDDMRLNTLKKAAIVWKDSTNQAHAQQAATFFEESAALLTERRQADEASKEWIAAGKIYARLMDEDSAEKASDLFDAAVLVHGNNRLRVAETHAAIGRAYANFLTVDPESSKTAKPQPNPTDVQAGRINRSREIGAAFFFKAAEGYEALGDIGEAAGMQHAAAQLLSQSDSPATLDYAVSTFSAAAALYRRTGDVEDQKTVLLQAGKIFLDKENPIQRRRASLFYDAFINLTTEDSEARAEAHIVVAKSYQTSTAQEDQLKAVYQYRRAAAIYQQQNKKDKQVDALLEAGAALNENNDATSQSLAMQLFEQALGVHENDLKSRVQSLSEIGGIYDASDKPEQKREAVKYYRLAATAARQAGDKSKELDSLLDAGNALLGLKDESSQSEAEGIFREAVNLYANDVRQQSLILSRVGSLHSMVKDPNKERVYRYYAQAVNLAHQQNDKEAEVNAILAQARTVARLEGEAGQSRVENLYGQAEAVYDGNPERKAATLVRIGRTILGRGNDRKLVTTAEKYFDRAVSAAGSNNKLLSSVQIEIGLAFQPSLQRARAVMYYQRALTISEQSGDKYGQAMALYRLSAVSSKEAKANTDRALTLFAEILPAVESSGNRTELAEAHHARGTLYRLRKEYQEAIESYKRALEIFRTLPDYKIRADQAENTIKSVQRLLDREREKPKEADYQQGLGYRGEVDRDAPSCFNSSRTATSSCESRSVSVSPIGRVTSMSTGRGLRSMLDPSLAVIFIRGRRKLVPSINDWFHVKIIHPEVGSTTT